jgi:hypothetical protein
MACDDCDDALDSESDYANGCLYLSRTAGHRSPGKIIAEMEATDQYDSVTADVRIGHLLLHGLSPKIVKARLRLGAYD